MKYMFDKDSHRFAWRYLSNSAGLIDDIYYCYAKVGNAISTVAKSRAIPGIQIFMWKFYKYSKT